MGKPKRKRQFEESGLSDRKIFKHIFNTFTAIVVLSRLKKTTMICCALKLYLKIPSNISTIGTEAIITKNTKSEFPNPAKVTTLKFSFAVHMRKVNSCAHQNAISEEGYPEKQSPNKHNTDKLFRWIS